MMSKDYAETLKLSVISFVEDMFILCKLMHSKNVVVEC